MNTRQYLLSKVLFLIISEGLGGVYCKGLSTSVARSFKGGKYSGRYLLQRNIKRKIYRQVYRKLTRLMEWKCFTQFIQNDKNVHEAVQLPGSYYMYICLRAIQHVFLSQHCPRKIRICEQWGDWLLLHNGVQSILKADLNISALVWPNPTRFLSDQALRLENWIM